MARSFGRLLASIWDDKDFRALTVTSRLMYTFLISQSDLEHSGIIPLRVPRWAHDMGLPSEDITAALKELGAARFVVGDEVAGELLVRSLIRRDEVWKQPNVFKSAATSARASKSAAVKGALWHEIGRLELAKAAAETRAIRGELLADLEPFGNPSPTPPEPPAKPSGTPQGSNWGDFTEGADQDPSETPGEPLANHSAGPQGMGNGYGPVLEDPPSHSPTPSPASSPHRAEPVRLFAVPDANPEEGDSRQDQTPDIAVLVAEVRTIRPEWSTDSIKRAVTCDAVTERPWPVTRAAMLAVARDPRSQNPGRLKHDGPWWREAGVRASRDSLPPVEKHPYEPGAGDICRECDMPKSNRRHLEAS